MDRRTCLKPYAERLSRQFEKERIVLRFLREELYSTSELLGQLLGLCSRQAVWKTLTQLARRDLIRRYEVSSIGGTLTVWGITPNGQAWAFGDGEDLAPRYFEPSKVSELTIRHVLAVQQLRIVAAHAGWKEWRNGNSLGAIPKNGKRPDGVVKDSDGLLVAIECERTFKSLKRYQSILGQYLVALKRGDYQRVVWVCPNLEQSRRLKRILLGIQTVFVNGQRLKVDPVRHHPPLAFADFDSFPNG